MTKSNKALMQQAIDSLIESARLLGATQEKRSWTGYTKTDSMFESACYEIIEAKKQTILDGIEQPDHESIASDAIESAAQPVPPTEPAAYAVYWGIGEMKKDSVHFERKTAEDVAAQIKSITEVRPLFAIAQPEQNAAASKALITLISRIKNLNDNWLLQWELEDTFTEYQAAVAHTKDKP